MFTEQTRSTFLYSQITKLHAFMFIYFLIKSEELFYGRIQCYFFIRVRSSLPCTTKEKLVLLLLLLKSVVEFELTFKLMRDSILYKSCYVSSLTKKVLIKL